MTTPVMSAVLAAALLHALWNSLVKSAGDKFMTSARVCLWCGLIACVVAASTPTPASAAFPFVIASAIIHVLYFVLVGRLYRTADLSVVYPLMRGLAPLIATAVAAALLAERPAPLALAGVLALVAGVLTMGANGLAHGRIDAATLRFAMVNAAVIAVYSVIDGEGARLAGPNMSHAFGYNAWADGLTAALYAPLLALWRGRGVWREFLAEPARAAAGGLAAFTGYALVVWAMTQAEIGAVAALRECSVVFAALIGVLALGEPFKRVRGAATLLILAGVAALKFA
ncbi:MAG: EamA family transporter [Pseudomonadota bacterium]|nr:EamA family transporter [Pseudomonadota bacterium]